MIPYVVTVLLLAPILCVSAFYQISQDYNEINKHLVENLPKNEDVKANLELAQQWLEKRHSRMCGLGTCIGSSLNQALKQFVDLYLLTRDSGKCSMQVIELLRTNMGPSGYRFNWYIHTSNVTRVSRLLKSIADELARDCVGTSEKQFYELIKSLDEEKLETVQRHLTELLEPVMDTLKDSPIGNDESSQLLFEFKHYNEWNPTEEDELVRSSLRLARMNLKTDLAPSKVHSKEERRGKVETFVEEFYLEPCRYYTEKMHDSLDPVLDYNWINTLTPSVAAREFYIGFGHYKWCKDLLRDSDRLIRAMMTLTREH